MATLGGIIEPIYFLITSISFILLSVIQYKKFGKTRETKYLASLSAFFLCSYIAIVLKGYNYKLTTSPSPRHLFWDLLVLDYGSANSCIIYDWSSSNSSSCFFTIKFKIKTTINQSYYLDYYSAYNFNFYL